MHTSPSSGLVWQPHTSRQPPAASEVTLLYEAMLEDVESRHRLTEQNALFQPVLEDVSRPGVPVALRRIRGTVLPKLNPDYVIRASLIIGTLLWWGNNVIGRTDDRRNILYPLNVIAKTAEGLDIGHLV